MLKKPTANIKLLFLTAVFVVAGGAKSADLMCGPNTARAMSTASNEIYARHCAECHGLDGRAKTAKGKRAGATDFTGTDWNTDEGRASRIITNGKGEMPSFKRKLTAKEISSVWGRVLRFRN